MKGLCVFSVCFFSFVVNYVECSGSESELASDNFDNFENTPNILSSLPSSRQKLSLTATDYSPEIEFENDYGSFHVRVKCTGHDVNSLSALQCNTPKECQQLMSCFDSNSTDCPKGQLIYRGQKCSSEDKKTHKSSDDGKNTDCFILEDRRWQLSSGLIECTTGNAVTGNSKRIVEQFFKGTDQYFHLVKSNAYQLSLAVREKQHEPVEYIEYVGKPVFYTNKRIDVHCRATRFLFTGINITVSMQDGTKHQIDANATLPGDEDKYWEQYYWEAYSPGMNVTADMTSFTCQGQRNDGSEWTLATFDFTPKEPSTPRIDKSQSTRTISWSSNKNDQVIDQYVGCNYTGGPAAVELTRERDGRNVIDRYITAYGEIRERRGLLQRHVYELQEGNYTCTVSNSHGNDSFQFYVDIPRSQGASQFVSGSLHLLLVSLILAVKMSLS